jgi:hypothetical protein
VPAEEAVALADKEIDAERDFILTDAKVTGSQIYITFDKAGKIPTVAELKKQLGPDVSITKFGENIVSATQGKVRYRIDAFGKEKAQELYDKHFGELGKSYHAKSELEKGIPLEDRFNTVVQAGIKAEAGVTPKPPVQEWYHGSNIDLSSTGKELPEGHRGYFVVEDKDVAKKLR